MKASIVIPTSNRAAALAKTLESLVNQDFDAREFAILVIENGTLGKAQRVVEAAAESHKRIRIRYFFDSVPGLLSGRHRGALEADGSIIVFIDDDIVADASWLAAIVETFEDPTVQLVGGRNLPAYESSPPDWLDAFWWGTAKGGRACCNLSLLDLGGSTKEIDANYVWGLNFAIRRDAVFDLGGFHPDCIPEQLQRFQGDGETGLTMKAKERGYRAVYQPKALVYHQVPASRLTPEYFEKRAFYQGVCDSYSKIRSQGAVDPDASGCANERQTAKTLLERITRECRRSVRHSARFLSRLWSQDRSAGMAQQVVNGDAETVKRRVQEAYEQGYQFHQNEVRNDLELLKWVLKEDYWDYRLPDYHPEQDTPCLSQP